MTQSPQAYGDRVVCREIKNELERILLPHLFQRRKALAEIVSAGPLAIEYDALLKPGAYVVFDYHDGMRFSVEQKVGREELLMLRADSCLAVVDRDEIGNLSGIVKRTPNDVI